MSLAEKSAERGVFPYKVEVLELLKGRYPEYPQGGQRPMSWSKRIAGQDSVVLTDGRQITLNSNGQQSPPAKGWVLMLLSGDQQNGFSWTLYGMDK